MMDGMIKNCHCQDSSLGSQSHNLRYQPLYYSSNHVTHTSLQLINQSSLPQPTPFPSLFPFLRQRAYPTISPYHPKPLKNAHSSDISIFLLIGYDIPFVENHRVSAIMILPLYILIKMEGKAIKRIGNYKITPHLLGRGAFSEVFLAFDQHDTKIAAKIIPIASLTNDFVASLEREINMLRKCKHENVVSLVDAKKSHNNLYIFMEYCEDGTLEDHIKNSPNLTEEEALALFFQIARGMQVLSVNKVIHRDLKPQNILMKNGVVKIADFGLARRFMVNDCMQTFVGTPSHMAPEILRGENYTEKVDVYSAGAILYEMIYGAAPFHFDGDYSKLLKAKDKGMRDCKVTDLSSETRNFLKKMLEPNPEDRLSMNGMLDFMDSFTLKQRQNKIDQYRRLSMKSMLSMGVMGAIIGAMNIKPCMAPSPKSMDLRLYGRLCQRLTTVNN